MFASAAAVQRLISMTSVKITSSTATVNLQSFGRFTPSIANCEIEQAPDQYHNLRTLVIVTSLPLRSLMTTAEVDEFLRTIKGHRLEQYFRFLLYTVCRRSEALSVNTADIDRKNRLLHIRGTKTDTSDRVVPLLDKAADLLNKLKPTADGFYFPFRPDYPTHAFKKLCPDHKLHDLRHTFATRCLEAKIPLKVVQKWLGHSKLDTTADIYSHVTADLSAAEADTLNRFLAAM